MRLDTKEKRDALRQSIFEGHIKNGFVRETYKGLEIFTKEDGGKYYLHVYWGNSSKDLNRYYFRDDARRRQVIDNYKQNYDARDNRKKETAEKIKLSKKEAEKKAASGEVVQADTKKSSYLLKKYIREKYGIECNIRSKSYSGGCSLNISYDLGCDSDLLSEIKCALEYGRFDGMTDYSYSVPVSSIIVDGFKLETFKHVFIRQNISEDFLKKAAYAMSQKIKFSGVPDLLPDFSNFRVTFTERCGDAWDWGQLIYQYFQPSNFQTQDEKKVNFVDVKYAENKIWGVVFYYTIEGDYTIYSTDRYIMPNEKKSNKTQIKREFEKVEAEQGKINIIQYSDKAIAVIGDTKPVKDILKGLGGSFNPRLSCGVGWIFPAGKRADIVEALKKHKEEKNTLHDEVQKTVDLFSEIDKQIFGEITETTQQISQIQNCQLN